MSTGKPLVTTSDKITAKHVRRASDLNDKQAAILADLWWSEHRVLVYTIFLQGVDGQNPRSCFQQAMRVAYPSASIGSKVACEAFFTRLNFLFHKDLV